MDEQQATESSAEPADCPRAYGFLTAVDSPIHGIFGGYLLVDPLGRPLEFHCTAPVKVSRAQQILFGSTLKPQLHGQQIGGTLLAEGTIQPQVVLTDLEPMMHVRGHTSLPVALVRGAPGRETMADSMVSAAATGAGSFAVGKATVSPHVHDAVRASELVEMLGELATAVDLCEPFERIRAAIEEAQRH
ncbi:MAG: hypothetical protein ACKOTB_19385 [Planctomycetia bacterium]